MSSPFAQATLQSLAEAALFGTRGLGGISVQINGTFVGTLQFEGTVDGENWRGLNVTPTNSSTAVTSATSVGIWTGGVVGLIAVRVRVSAYTSGTPRITFSGTEASPGGGGGAGGGAGGDGAVVDGVTSSIRASVLDYLNSKPLAVRLSNTSGDYVSAGAGTAYVEDVAAAADPEGGAMILVRTDTPTARTDANGDNVVATGTNKGEQYVKDADAAVALGPTNETAPGSDTATIGLNGRLQRIAQRLTSLIAATATETSLSALAGDLGDSADAEATGNGSLIAILKRVRTQVTALLTPVATISATPVMRVAVFDAADAQITNFGGSAGLTDTQLRATAVPISAASLPLPTGAGTAAKQDTGNASLASLDGKTTAVNTGAVVVASSALPTGAATLAKQPALGTAGTSSADVITVQGRAAMTPLLVDPSAVTSPVSLASVPSHAVTNVGTFAVQLATNTPVGTVAHDAADSGAPVKVGGRADTTFQAAVADGDRVDALFDVYGQQRIRNDHANLWSYHADGSTALTDASVQGAPGAGLSVYITDLIVSLGAATALNAFLEEGSTKILGPWYLEAVAGRTVHIKFATPKKCTANTAVTVTTSASVAHAVDILGFIAP